MENKEFSDELYFDYSPLGWMKFSVRRTEYHIEVLLKSPFFDIRIPLNYKSLEMLSELFAEAAKVAKEKPAQFVGAEASWENQVTKISSYTRGGPPIPRGDGCSL